MASLMNKQDKFKDAWLEFFEIFFLGGRGETILACEITATH